MKANKKAILPSVAGVAIGFVNSFLGAGGGTIAVPLLKKTGLSQKEAHINAVAVILPVTVVSAGYYILKGSVSVSDAFPYIPSGILGAVIGSFIMKKISPLFLKRIFGAFMIYAGIRLLLR